MAPRDLWLSAPEYQQTFKSLKRFRSHLYKEDRANREGVYWVKKRNDEGKKKHDKEVARMQEE